MPGAGTSSRPYPGLEYVAETSELTMSADDLAFLDSIFNGVGKTIWPFSPDFTHGLPAEAVSEVMRSAVMTDDLTPLARQVCCDTLSGPVIQYSLVLTQAFKEGEPCLCAFVATCDKGVHRMHLVGAWDVFDVTAVTGQRSFGPVPATEHIMLSTLGYLQREGYLPRAKFPVTIFENLDYRMFSTHFVHPLSDPDIAAAQAASDRDSLSRREVSRVRLETVVPGTSPLNDVSGGGSTASGRLNPYAMFLRTWRDTLTNLRDRVPLNHAMRAKLGHLGLLVPVVPDNQVARSEFAVSSHGPFS
jgi:hypothetical protein